MTINIADNSPRISYSVAEGVTQTSFAVPFEFFDNPDLNVYLDGTLQTITTNYTVAGGDGSTGTVTMSVTGASGGSTVVITRGIELERTTDFPVSGAFNIVALNTELDRLVAIAADLEDRAARAIQAQDFDSTVSYTLPLVDDRKGKVLGFNATTGAVEAGPEIADTQSLADVSADIALLADIEDGTTDTNAITNLNGIRANVTTVSGISGNVTTVANNDTNVTTVADNDADITTVATNISSVNTVATNIADVITVANDLNEAISEVETVANDLNEAVSEIDTVASSITNVDVVGNAITNVNTVATDLSGTNTVGTVATNIANVNTVAGISGNVTTVAGISAAVTTVANDGTDIGTVATNIANVNSVAANENNINAAVSNASNINAVVADAVDIGTVASDISNVNTVAGISGNVTTVAGIFANVTTVSGISSYVTTVAGDTANIGTIATNLNGSDTIGTVAGIASNVTTVAGISASVTAVAGDAVDIGAVAANISGSDTIGTVAASISNVNSVGSNISNVNTVATNLTSINSFANTYRIGSTDPTTSLDGGDLFYNTTAGVLKVYNASTSSWEQGVTAGSGFLPLSGGTLTGTLALSGAPTQNLHAASKQYVDTEVAAILDSAPATLDTLNELAAALGDDANFSTTVTNSIATKLPLAGGTMTGAITFASGQTFDGRDVSADGAKLDGIEVGATADQTKSDIDALGIAASTANTLATARNIALSGDVSGSASFNGSSNITITATVADDSHNHVINNVDGLQSALDAKLSTSGGTLSGDLTVNGGDIVLGGTGRIQGIDTVSASTDAASKSYVDTAVASSGTSYATILAFS